MIRALLLSLSFLLLAEGVLTERDVVRMLAEGSSEKEVLAAIRSHEGRYDLSDDMVGELRRAGVSAVTERDPPCAARGFGRPASAAAATAPLVGIACKRKGMGYGFFANGSGLLRAWVSAKGEGVGPPFFFLFHSAFGFFFSLVLRI